MKNQNIIGLLLLAPLGRLEASAICKTFPYFFFIFAPMKSAWNVYDSTLSILVPAVYTHVQTHYGRNTHTSHDRYFPTGHTHGATIQYGRTRTSNFSSKCVCARTFSMLVFFKYRQGRSGRLPIGTKSLLSSISAQ